MQHFSPRHPEQPLPRRQSLHQSYPPAFAVQTTAQPPAQMPYSDPFSTGKDPFYPASHSRRESFGVRAWQPTPPGSNGTAPPLLHHPSHQPAAQPYPPSHLSGSSSQMPVPPYDAPRRASLGGATSPSQSHEHASSHHSSYVKRAMPPPPSPPYTAQSTTASSTARGPSAALPFPSLRDFSSSNRSGSGMSISSMLGGGESDSHGRRQSPAPPSTLSQSLHPPSPGRARSSSMREGYLGRDMSPQTRHSAFGEYRAASTVSDRPADYRREGGFGSPHSRGESMYSFRSAQHDTRRETRDGGLPRPTSQPTERAMPRDEDVHRRDPMGEPRLLALNAYADSQSQFGRADQHRYEPATYLQNGVTSNPRDHDYVSHMERDPRYGPSRYGTDTQPFQRDDSAFSARRMAPSHYVTPRDYGDPRATQSGPRDVTRSSPPVVARLDGRNAPSDRPMTFEEHQRAESSQRENRKQSDGIGYRALIHNLSPDLNRKGRNSPLPQAVQGAQPRHIGPGGDNPGIKMEFGRMFSGLGSGVGSNTPAPANGSTTPSRISLVRHGDVRDNGKVNGTDGEDLHEASRAGRGTKLGRRPRDEDERILGGRDTPDGMRGNAKRPKASHQYHHHVHAHHHHHHRHDPVEEPQNGTFNMLRLPSNTTATHTTPAQHTTPHFHHHHNVHGHSGHHHHHHTPRAPAAPIRQSTLIVVNKKLLEEAATQPRKHLGSQLYTTARISLPSRPDAALKPSIRYKSATRAIPLFEGKVNCTFTVRVPRWHLHAAGPRDDPTHFSPMQEVCQHGQIWGSEVYTDDSDVVAAAVHSGWLRGDFGDLNGDLQELIDRDKAVDAGEEPPLVLLRKPDKPARPLAGHDLHVTVLILPPLQSYPGTLQNHVRSRDWDKTHDGMSMMIHRVDFVNEGLSSRSAERGLASRKSRMAEEAKRREAASSLLLFANGSPSGPVSVGA